MNPNHDPYDDWAQAILAETHHIEGAEERRRWQRDAQSAVRLLTWQDVTRHALLPVLIVTLIATRDVLAYNLLGSDRTGHHVTTGLLGILAVVPTLCLALIGAFTAAWHTRRPALTAAVFGLYVPFAWLVALSGSTQHFSVGFSHDAAIAAQMVGSGLAGATLATLVRARRSKATRPRP